MVSFEIKGLDVALKGVGQEIKKAEALIQDQLNGWAEETVTLAKQLAPTDEGHLKGSINAKKGKLFASVTVAVNYAAYLEFGTKKFASAYVSQLPQDWQSFAAQYKGPGGGSFEEFVMRLTKWVKRKGIGATYNVATRRRDRVGKQSAKTTMEADAYAIALYIIRNGIKAQPYLYPAYIKTVGELKKNLINSFK